MATRARARLTAYEPPKKPGRPPGAMLGSPISFQFNPEALTLSKGAQWIRHRARSARQVGVPEFTGSLPRRLGVELFLDATATHDTSVQKAVETLLSWCVPTARSIAAKAASAPRVKFSWGSFDSVSFFGYLEEVNASYSLFDSDGTPLRATCAIQLTEAGDPTPRQNPTSGSPGAHRTHRLVAGDSLEALAHEEYGDPTAWRLIAEANGIDDPLRLRPGAELLVPSADELEAR
ncbi:peptidase M23 [Streptomyces sp. TRM 70361]|uniref:CIS tube protein n=1 Tax=Streptomyces sp. TRM 70361 TaxID=3116553 RepID=UPI002E7BC2C1|nr:peptidase M23 [Streptomyces sp. TRM 70361]MEE1940292.1 peptidase M23 [Streptomyces sp. TRM 70361]